MKLLGEHLLDGGHLRHERPDLDALDEIAALLPIAVLKSLAGLHDVITCGLGRASEDLAIGEIKKATEGLRDDLALLLFRIEAREKRNLHEHAGHEECCFQKFGVDVHMERQLALALSTLLLGRECLVTLLMDSLSE
jgi:hypothetical protein